MIDNVIFVTEVGDCFFSTRQQPLCRLVRVIGR